MKLETDFGNSGSTGVRVGIFCPLQSEHRDRSSTFAPREGGGSNTVKREGAFV